MTITRKNFEVLKQTALLAGSPEALKAITETETAAEQASKKTSAYILEKRKKNPLYCR